MKTKEEINFLLARLIAILSEVDNLGPDEQDIIDDFMGGWIDRDEAYDRLHNVITGEEE